MKLNRKLWTAALAVAMTTPSAMAAQDTAGMHYTSASEGFYASIRVRFESNGTQKKDGGSNIGNSSSRFGVRGTNDLGGGMEGFYQYEAGVGVDNSSGLSTRVGVVGLRGDFGEVAAGSFWVNSYNWVYGSTDIANVGSGAFAYGGLGELEDRSFGQGRSKRSVQYTTPDLNGFQAAILVQADSSRDGEGSIHEDKTYDLVFSRDQILDVPVTNADTGATVAIVRATLNLKNTRVSGVSRKQLPGQNGYYLEDPLEGRGVGIHDTVKVEEVPGKNPKDDNDIDHWNLSAKYDIAGFSTAFSYSRFVDNTGDKNGGRGDGDSWAVKLGYSQDNWYANSWYGQIEDHDGLDDLTAFSIAGGVSVDKVGVYAVYDTIEEEFAHGTGKKGMSDSYSTLGVQYNLGSRSRVWVEYQGQDRDTSSNEADRFTMGLRHDF